MRVVVTGAAGFVGEGLAQRLVADPRLNGEPIADFVLADRAASDCELPEFAEWRCGDLTDPSYLDALFERPIDVLFHLASIPGAAAERLGDGGQAVNLDVPLALARRLAAQARSSVATPRMIFASTIAVYGELPRSPFDESALPRPNLSYGAHKLMAEIFLADLSRRGAIDARSVRLPGIVARPPSETGHGSAFLSQLFHKARAGEAFVCPVGPDATSWWMSRRACVDNLLRAASMPGEASRRVWQLPALQASIGDVVAALERRFGTAATAQFTYEQDDKICRLFADMPPIRTPGADLAGFASDVDVEKLVANVFD